MSSASRRTGVVGPVLRGIVLGGAVAGLVVGGCIEDAVLIDAGSGGQTTQTTGSGSPGGGGEGGNGGSSSNANGGNGGSTTNANGGSGGSGGNGGSGGAVGCTGPEDCPGMDTDCSQRTCNDGACGIAFTAEAVPCNDDGGALCDGDGNCVECLLDQHCNNEPCNNNICGALLPDGDACSGDAQCESGHCTDGVCCDVACDGLCEACVQAKTCGTDGVCSPIPGGTDPDNECNGNATCIAGNCLDARIVFTTSQGYSGNLGGLAGADQLCNTHAANACLGGTYMAWLSTAAESPSTRFTAAAVPYVRVDGTQLAPNFNGVIDGNLSAPIDKDENGDPPPLAIDLGGCTTDLVFTGTTPLGVADGAPENRCQDWTSANSNALWGRWMVATGNWTDYCTGNGVTCNNEYPLYCFQQ